MANTAAVVSTGQIIITEVAERVVEITTPGTPALVEIAVEGPKGIQGPQGIPGTAVPLGALPDVNLQTAVDNSILVYDATTQTWVGKEINTTVTLTDGGNF